jgi:hypothetical protein
MVLRPKNYAPDYPNNDLILRNKGHCIKDRDDFMEDVGYARTLSDYLRHKIPLNFDVCHSLGHDIEGRDFF